MAKTYGQYCGLARTLDHIGDRWTLLVIRELMVSVASYGELLVALDGVPTNLLADRLRQLEADTLIRRETDPDDRRRVTYSLTPLGAELEPAVLALIRWGTAWMRSGPGPDRFDPRWAVLALRALIRDRVASRDGVLEVRVEHIRLHIISTSGAPLVVGKATAIRSDARVGGSPELLLGVSSGQLTMTEAMRRGLRVLGRRPLARAVLQP